MIRVEISTLYFNNRLQRCSMIKNDYLPLDTIIYSYRDDKEAYTTCI